MTGDCEVSLYIPWLSDEMIHERENNASIHGTRVPEGKSGGNAICCWFIEVVE